MMKISRHYFQGHNKADNFETHLAIYEDRVRGWFLDEARTLEKMSDHSSFVVLLVVLSFIEGLAIFLKGQDSKNNSAKFFKEAFKTIFETPTQYKGFEDKAVDALYDQMRCGLFHTGMMRGNITLTSQLKIPIQCEMDIPTKKAKEIKVNPHLMLNSVELYFSQYTMRLRDPEEKELRENFEKAWNIQNPKPKV